MGNAPLTHRYQNNEYDLLTAVAAWVSGGCGGFTPTQEALPPAPLWLTAVKIAVEPIPDSGSPPRI
jgi:hypothetical protein